MQRFPWFILFALLTACTTTPSGLALDPSKNEGLITGTITYDSSIGLYSLRAYGPYGVPAPEMSVGYSMWPPLGPLFDDALKTKGGTFLVSAQPGQYAIVGWQVKQGYKVSTSAHAVNIPFTVERGKATYVGSLHFDADWNVSLRDRATRDLPVLNERYAVLKSAPIAFTITPGAEITGLGGDYNSRVQMPAVIFVPAGR